MAAAIHAIGALSACSRVRLDACDATAAPQTRACACTKAGAVERARKLAREKTAKSGSLACSSIERPYPRRRGYVPDCPGCIGLSRGYRDLTGRSNEEHAGEGMLAIVTDCHGQQGQRALEGLGNSQIRLARLSDAARVVVREDPGRRIAFQGSLNHVSSVAMRMWGIVRVSRIGPSLTGFSGGHTARGGRDVADCHAM